MDTSDKEHAHYETVYKIQTSRSIASGTRINDYRHRGRKMNDLGRRLFARFLTIAKLRRCFRGKEHGLGAVLTITSRRAQAISQIQDQQLDGASALRNSCLIDLFAPSCKTHHMTGCNK